jgi:hypothetical protein
MLTRRVPQLTHEEFCNSVGPVFNCAERRKGEVWSVVLDAVGSVVHHGGEGRSPWCCVRVRVVYSRRAG